MRLFGVSGNRRPPTKSTNPGTADKPSDSLQPHQVSCDVPTLMAWAMRMPVTTQSWKSIVRLPLNCTPFTCDWRLEWTLPLPILTCCCACSILKALILLLEVKFGMDRLCEATFCNSHCKAEGMICTQCMNHALRAICSAIKAAFMIMAQVKRAFISEKHFLHAVVTSQMSKWWMPDQQTLHLLPGKCAPGSG